MMHVSTSASECVIPMGIEFLVSLEERARLEGLIDELQDMTHVLHKQLVESRLSLFASLDGNCGLRQRLAISQMEFRASRATESVRRQREQETEAELLVAIAALRQRINDIEACHQRNLQEQADAHSHEVSYLQNFYALQVASLRHIDRSISPSPSPPSTGRSTSAIAHDTNHNFAATFAVRILPRIPTWAQCRCELSRFELTFHVDGGQRPIPCSLHCVGPIKFETSRGRLFALSFDCFEATFECAFETRDDRARWAHRVRSFMNPSKKQPSANTQQLLKRRQNESDFTRQAAELRANLSNSAQL